jgi:hypothetical protein
MSPKTIYCAECMEDIPNSEAQWEDGKLYCGRCGSELSPDTEDRDLLDEISSGKPRRLYTLENEDVEEEDDEEEDDDFDDEDEDGDFDDEEEEDEEQAGEEEDSNGGGRPRSGKRR